jgi:hypothetical protein
VRQIAGLFAEYEKARKRWAEINPELVRQVRRLRRRSPKGHQRSLRDVAAELAKLGFLNERGTPLRW